MFLGHFGLGFAGKRVAPALSLGTLFLAVQFADLLFWVLALLGVEHFRIQPGATRMTPMDFSDYPISHSLAGLLVWGLFIGGAYWLLRRDRVAALVLGAGVLSHWILDALVHRPDMPLWPGGGPRVGLSIWDRPAPTVVLELLVYGLGLAIYLKTTRAVDRTGNWALWSLVVFLAATWIASIAGPPPPNERVVEWSGLAMWLFVPWGWWIDRHRTIVAA
ncbi:MAG: metal-dependent hydrolase [Acidobacteriota bacterium]